MKRKQYEDKFDVDVTDDPTTGTTKVTDRVKDEVFTKFFDNFFIWYTAHIFFMIEP